MNTIFFFAGIALHGTMADYVQAVKDATPGVSGIIFQFPLFFWPQSLFFPSFTLYREIQLSSCWGIWPRPNKCNN
uniref:TIGR00366 family protein n=1 Tax=Acetomicrobium sp. S15 = DSM 107314 TaxID=2529858 RepID=UPI0031590CA6